jgi:hypothetical protein
MLLGGRFQMPTRHKQYTTRRRIMKAAFAVLGGGGVAIGSARAGEGDPVENRATEQVPPAKFTPEAVHYQAAPNDWQKCLFCQYFKEPSTCGILTVPVSRNGWCDHFALLHE